ncbi:hypothetical protein LguiA_028159 [Lonicera macranthoides]
MEEEKAAAYYDELTRKGEGAARFKQGLGFSSTTANDSVPTRGSALPSPSSSFLSSFVRASTPSKPSDLQKEAQLVTIQNKLQKKHNPSLNNNNHRTQSASRDPDRDRDRDRHSSRQNRSPGRDDHRSRRHRSPSRDRVRIRDKDRDRKRRRRRSRSRSVSDEERGRPRGRGSSRSLSPRDRRSEKGGSDGGSKGGKGKSSGINYAKLIEGYDTMTPAERVKAKMKLQLSETSKKDATNGMGSGWERFDFDKDAPLDDEEIEAAEDDAELVKHIGQSFRFNAVKAKREDEIKAAHDEAMFGVSSVPLSADKDSDVEGDNNELPSTETTPVTNFISNQVLAMQKGSWRDRVGKK